MAFKLFLPFACIFFFASFVLPVLSHLVPNGLSGNETNSSRLGFLKAIQGCRKGETVTGIRDLKLYLARFGYLNYQKNPNVTDLEQDHFDEELEAALKSYQVYYHLNATGTLDGPTVSQMALPRCGFPDKETHKNADSSIHTVSHYRLYAGRLKWPSDKSHLTYGFGPLYPAQFMAPVDQAFGKWATASSGYFTFSRAGSYQAADLKISFERGDHGDRPPFQGPLDAVAHAFAPTDGRLHFDADESWTIGAMPNTLDVETVALHEIGHLLGLDHSEVQDAIMWPSLREGVTKGLNSDDIEGLRDLYGVTKDLNSDDMEGLSDLYGNLRRFSVSFQ